MNEMGRVAKARGAFARINDFLYQNGVAKIDETPGPGGITISASSEARGGTHDFSWHIDGREGVERVALTLKKTGLMEIELSYSALTDAWRLRWDIDPEQSLNGWAGIEDRQGVDVHDCDVETLLRSFIECAGIIAAERPA